MNSASVSSPAATTIDADVVKSGQLTRLIAYLSVCMLAAAFGAMVGPVWSYWWMLFGTFGLASAVGLDIVNRSRARRIDRVRSKRNAMRFARKLDELMSEMQVSDAIRAALHLLQPDAKEPTAQDTMGQAEARLFLDKPATIRRLLRSSGSTGYQPGEPLAGRMRNISRHGFGLAHDQRLERGFVLLECELENGQPIQFVGAVLWCERQEDGCYFSGGKLLDVLIPGGLQSKCVT